MAYCNNCGREFNAGKTTCDGCGAKKPSSTGPLLAGIILGGVLTFWTMNAMKGDPPQTPSPVLAEVTTSAALTPKATGPVDNSETAVPTPAPTPTPAPVPVPTIGRQWNYSMDEDPMTSAKTYFASVKSTNTVEFGFPYGGTQRGRLMLRTHPRHGKDVIFTIERGQILCPSYEGCRVLVRFDEEKAQSYGANGPADNSNETLFLEGYDRFAAKLLKANRVRISAEIYQQGAPVFEFDVSGFDVKKYRPEN